MLPLRRSSPIWLLRYRLLICANKNSSNFGGVISYFKEARVPIHDILPPAVYLALPTTMIPRDQWLTRYRDHVFRLFAQVLPWPERRVSRTSLAELTLKFFFRHLSEPNDHPFPTPPISSRTSLIGNQKPYLVTSVLISATNCHEPSNAFQTKIFPILFKSTDRFEHLLTMEQLFEHRHCQTL